jgi:hypothetical protein
VAETVRYRGYTLEITDEGVKISHEQNQVDEASTVGDATKLIDEWMNAR